MPGIVLCGAKTFLGSVRCLMRCSHARSSGIMWNYKAPEPMSEAAYRRSHTFKAPRSSAGARAKAAGLRSFIS